jgi:fatty-acid desaturase
MVSGAPPSAYWAANLCWDLLNFALPAAGIVGLVYVYNQPALSGIRLVAMALLLLAFSGAGITLTYLAHFAFNVSSWQ